MNIIKHTVWYRSFYLIWINLRSDMLISMNFNSKWHSVYLVFLSENGISTWNTKDPNWKPRIFWMSFLQFLVKRICSPHNSFPTTSILIVFVLCTYVQLCIGHLSKWIEHINHRMHWVYAFCQLPNRTNLEEEKKTGYTQCVCVWDSVTIILLALFRPFFHSLCVFFFSTWIHVSFISIEQFVGFYTCRIVFALIFCL